MSEAEILEKARTTPVESLPALVGVLAQAGAIAHARLAAPQPQQHQHDELLDVDTAARRLCVSRDYLYRHHRELSFTRRVGKRLLFSATGLQQHIESSKL